MKVLALLLLLIPGVVNAEDDPFGGLDLDGDGYVSLAEAAGYAEIVTRFDRADRNRDGKLSRAEFERMKTLRPRSAAAGASAPPEAKKPEAKKRPPRE